MQTSFHLHCSYNPSYFSAQFLFDELEYSQHGRSAQAAQDRLHAGDQHVSVGELWTQWKRSDGISSYQKLIFNNLTFGSFYCALSAD